MYLRGRTRTVRADNYLLHSTGECFPFAALLTGSKLSSAEVMRGTKKICNRKPIYVAVSPFSKNWACLEFFFLLIHLRGQGQLVDKEIRQVLAFSSIQDVALNRKQSLDTDVNIHTMLGFMIAIRKNFFFSLQESVAICSKNQRNLLIVLVKIQGCLYFNSPGSTTSFFKVL